MGSLQVRLFLSYLVIIAVTLGLTALGLFLLLGGYRDSISYGNLEDVGVLINEQANAEIRSIREANVSGSEQLSGQDLLLLLRSFLERPANGRGETSVVVVDTSGAVIAAASDTLREGVVFNGLTLSANASATNPERCRIATEQSGELLCVSMPLSSEAAATFGDAHAAAIVVARPAATLGEVFGDLAPRLMFSGLMGVAAALGLGFLLSQSVASPLRKIGRAARNVARGSYGQRVPVTGPREVREVATNFNRMTEEVRRSQQTLRDFLMNISHELKTPLTSIRGFSQAVLDGTIDDKPGVDRSAKIINDEATRVLRLVEELLDLSRMESGQISMRQEDMDLAELLEHVSEVFALRSEETGVALTVQQPGPLLLRGDFDRLEQVLNNLLDNAFRHTPEGGAVRVTARPVQHGFVQVTVSDSGRGIPPEDLPHLFERFYRAANGRNMRGYGLGLAITREIVRSHGGDIWATSEQGRGTSFVFTLPAGGGAVAPSGAARPARVARQPGAQSSSSAS